MSKEQGLSPKEMGIEGKNFAVRNFDELEKNYTIKAPYKVAISRTKFLAEIIKKNGGATEEEIRALGFVKIEEAMEEAVE